MNSEDPVEAPESTTTEIGVFHCTRCGRIRKAALIEPIPICCEQEMCLAFHEPE
jgi:hypothetical protein